VSVSLEVYPELLLVGRGFRLVVHNPTSATQDVTVKFQDDTGVFFQVIATGVGSGEFADTLVTEEDIGLSAKANKNVVAYAEIPPPASGVVLLGTNQAPGTRGNAVVIRTTSTVKLTIVDEAGNPIPFAAVNLLNLNNGRLYTYTADANGVCTIPDRPTGTYGKWALEVYKLDPTRQLVAYAIVQDFNFTDQVVTCKWAKNFLVEVSINFPKGNDLVVRALKNASACLPEPLKTLANWLAGAYGWASDQVHNFVLSMYINEIRNKIGGNVTYVRQEDNTLKIGFSVGYGSPIAFIAVLPWIAGIIIAVCSTIIAYFISIAVVAWSPSKAYEEQRKLIEQQQQFLNQASQAYQQGALTKEQLDQIVRAITEAINNYRNNIPPPGIDITGIATLAVVVLVLILIISLIRAVRGKE